MKKLCFFLLIAFVTINVISCCRKDETNYNTTSTAAQGVAPDTLKNKPCPDIEKKFPKGAVVYFKVNDEKGIVCGYAQSANGGCLGLVNVSYFNSNGDNVVNSFGEYELYGEDGADYSTEGQ